ncbi:MAG: alpha/beta fold hydrolase [Lautropia sp.]
MATARINGIDLHYELHGSGPALVLVHGALGNRLGWWQQVPALSRRFTCVLVDQRGFGASAEAAGGPGMQAFPDDLLALLDALGLERAALLGQSLGGWTCLAAALRRPERVSALILADTHARIADPDAAELRRRRQERGEIPDSLRLRALAPDFPERHPELTHLYFQIEALNPPRPPDYFSGYFGPGIIEPRQLATLAIPTLFVVGEQDVGTPPAVVRLLARHLPDARVAEISQAGHSAYFERADAFNRAVLAFLADVSQA